MSSGTASVRARLVERAFDILFAFSEAATGCTLIELSRKTGLPGATALRILRTLVDIEVVSFDAAKKQYFLGPAMYRLAASNPERKQFRKITQPLIDQFRDQMSETICIFQYDRNDRVCVAAAPCTRELSFFIEPGSRRAMLVGAPGKVLLSYMEGARREGFYAGLTARRRHEIEAECAEILRTGVAYSRDEIVVGGAALCVPIFDNLGLAGGLTILGPAARLSESAVLPMIAPLKAMAGEITKRLGGRSPAKSPTQHRLAGREAVATNGASNSSLLAPEHRKRARIKARDAARN